MSGFDLTAIQTQGNTAGVRAQAREIAMGWRHNAVTEWTPKFGSLIEMFRDIAPTGRRA